MSLVKIIISYGTSGTWQFRGYNITQERSYRQLVGCKNLGNTGVSCWSISIYIYIYLCNINSKLLIALKQWRYSDVIDTRVLPKLLLSKVQALAWRSKKSLWLLIVSQWKYAIDTPATPTLRCLVWVSLQQAFHLFSSLQVEIMFIGSRVYATDVLTEITLIKLW